VVKVYGDRASLPPAGGKAFLRRPSRAASKSCGCGCPELVLEVGAWSSRGRSRSSQMPLPEPLLAVPAGRPPEAPRGLGKISTEFDLEDRRPAAIKMVRFGKLLL